MKLIGTKGITDLTYKLRKVILYSETDEAGLRLRLLFIVKFQQMYFITEEFKNHLLGNNSYGLFELFSLTNQCLREGDEISQELEQKYD